MINNKSDFFKKVLATAAVVGTLTGGAMEAAARDVGGADINLSAVAVGAFAAGDALNFDQLKGGNAVVVTVNDYGNPPGGGADPVVIGDITLAVTKGALTLGQNTEITQITGGGNGSLSFITANKALNFIGAVGGIKGLSINASGGGAVSFGDSITSADAPVSITAGTGALTLGGNIATTGAAGGITIDASALVGGNALTAANRTLTTDVGNITVIGGGNANVTFGAVATGANGANGGDISLTGSDQVNKNVTFGVLTGVGGTVTVTAGTDAGGTIKTGNIASTKNAANAGGRVTITGGVGNIEFDDLAAADLMILTAGNGAIVSTGDVVANNGAQLNLGNGTNNIDINGNLTLIGDVAINTTTAAGPAAGKIIVGGDFDGGGVAALVVKINDAVVPAVGTKLTLIEANNVVAVIPNNLLAVNAALGAGLMKYTIAKDGNNLVATSRIDPVAVYNAGSAAVAAGKDKDVAKQQIADILAEVATSPELQDMQTESILEKFNADALPEYEASHRVDLGTTGATMQAASAAMSGVSDRVASVVQSAMASSAPRMESMTSSPSPSSSAVSGSSGSTKQPGSEGAAAHSKDNIKSQKVKGNSGQNSGDEALELGVWASGFGGVANQKSKGFSAPYKTKFYGGSLGIDTAVNEQLTAGLAFTQARVNVNYKGTIMHNTTKADMSSLVIYGFYDFENSWFTRGMLSYGQSSILNKTRRASAILNSDHSVSYAIAKGKYKSRVGSADITAGYRYSVEGDVSITPTLGLTYSQYHDTGYTETGANFTNDDQNKTVKKKNYDQFMGTVGASLGTKYNIESGLFIPEIHGFLSQVLGVKNPKVVSVTPGMPSASNTFKPTKTTWNAGLSGTVKSGMTEFGVGYDATISKKYLGHQGSVKLRVNF